MFGDQVQAPFLFWNINRRPLQDEVARLAAEYNAKFVVLAECSMEPETVLSAFESAGIEGFKLPYSPSASSSDIRIFCSMDVCELQPVFDDPNNHITIRRLVFPALHDLLLVAVHSQSKFNFGEDEQAGLAGRLARRILEIETEFNHRRTVLVGDLNMNPFEKGVVGSDGLHAVMTKKIASRKSRVVASETRHFFYNPMWQFFGDRSGGPPGTYYYSGSGKLLSFFWNMFDQVLVRPDLIDALTEVKIIDAIGAMSLLDNNGIPDRNIGSDHLPIYFSLNLA